MTPTTKERAQNMLSLIKTTDTFIVLDRESTSVRPNMAYGKITELSAVKIKNGKVIDSFDTLVDPEMKIPKMIVDLVGITDNMVRGKPKYPVAVKNFLKFCEGTNVIIAHNANTDVDYINFFAAKIGMKFEPDVIDTITLARYIHRKDDYKKFNLGDLARKYHVENQQHHRSMNDVMVTVQLFNKFCVLLKKDIEAAPTATIENKQLTSNVDMKQVEVRDCNLWQKSIKGKDFSRLYIKLYYNRLYNNVFYDFVMQRWGIKDLSFELPEGYEKAIVEKVVQMKHISKKEFYIKETFL